MAASGWNAFWGDPEAFRKARLEAFREARFKQVNGDFVFRAPGVVPQHYLVSAAQKAEVQRLLGARRVFHRYTIIIFVMLVVFNMLTSWVDRVEATIWPGFAGFFIVVGLWSLIEQHALFRRIGPALEGARYTEKRIAWRERAETLVRLLPISNMIAPGVALALVAFGGAVALLTVPPWFGFGIFSPSSSLVGILWGAAASCALGAGYFFYLAALKLLRR